MARMKDLTGKKFGRLTVVEYAGKESCANGSCHLWKCRCDCGNERVIKARYLHNGKGGLKSCGCLLHDIKRYKDLRGMQFGRLTVIEKSETSTPGKVRWLCKCSCGNIKLASAKDLLYGSIKSCGCLQLENVRKYHDLTGMRFGRLTVIKVDHNTASGHRFWLCKCDCGNVKVCSGGHLKRGDIMSCGCLQRELSSKRMTDRFQKNITVNDKKYAANSKICKKYYAMVGRCYDTRNASYHRYGEIGISVDKRWYDPSRVKPGDRKLRDEVGLAQFIADMVGSYDEHVVKYGAKNTSLDRIDGHKNYSVDNCRWATPVIQNNNLSSNRHIFDGDEILTFAECVRKYIDHYTLSKGYCERPSSIITARLQSGWTVNQIIAMLKIAKSTGHILTGPKERDTILARKIDQSVVYEKYPDEKRLPGY